MQTPPLTDLRLGLICLPIWWVLGVEQMIWAPIGVVAFAKVLVARRWRLRMPPFALWSVLFLAVHLASGVFIVEGIRVITFARTFGAYVAATLWVVVLANTVDSLKDARKVLASAAIAVSLSSLLGFIGIAGVWRGQFSSPMGMILPESITSTTYGGHIAQRSTGAMAWFVGFGDYFRVDSVFLFATLFATAIAVTIPILLWLLKSTPTLRGRIGWSVCLFFTALNLPFTTGRVAIASLIAGAAWFALVRRPTRIAASAVVAFAFSAILATNTDVVGLATTGVEAAAYARGSGSVEGRSDVYRSTIVGFLERPILGWGTERDVPNQRYPAGSHSTYLGLLYKHGVVGFVCFMGVLASAWLATRPERASKGTPAYTLLRFGQWTLVVVLLNAFTDVLDLDATTLIIIYAILGTLVRVRRLAEPAYIR